jgi:hypothetical protein
MGGQVAHSKRAHVMNNTVLLSHEKLDVYQKAAQLLALSASIYSNFPRG